MYHDVKNDIIFGMVHRLARQNLSTHTMHISVPPATVKRKDKSTDDYDCYSARCPSSGEFNANA